MAKYNVIESGSCPRGCIAIDLNKMPFDVEKKLYHCKKCNCFFPPIKTEKKSDTWFTSEDNFIREIMYSVGEYDPIQDEWY
ncbi:hypothetical protein IJ00_11455 [Calothrix sp. 336/3]|nr:hypothetical protein IJ00_11455 [Calothrix sp. 336/3]